MSLDLLPAIVFTKFEVAETHHAASILFTDFRAEWEDLVGMLSEFVLRKSDIVTPGGRKSPISVGIDRYSTTGNGSNITSRSKFLQMER